MIKFTFVLLFLSSVAVAQVGIGTTNPSPASMLEVSSTSNDIDYKGFMPPRVNLEQRDLIPVSSEDAGLIVFIDEPSEAEQCLQIWNGIDWQNIYCINDIGFSNVVQNFDSGTSWSYSTDVAFFESNTGFFGIGNAEQFSAITTLTNNFLAINDLNNDENGTSAFATISFDPVDVSSLPNGATVSFNYEFVEFDNGDDAFYTLVIDGVDQEEVLLIDGQADLSIDGVVNEIVPPGTASVALRIRIKQDGARDYAGFDNFVISAN